MKFNIQFICALCAVAASAFSPTAQASYSQIITFGDSLSDNGNLLALVGSPGAPYDQGRFSNGPVAVEVMAQQLKLSLTDYAYGGAQTGYGSSSGNILNGTGVQGQIAAYGNALTQAQVSADPSALYVVWAGPNDFFAGSAMFAPDTATTAVANLKSDIYNLYQLGARNFFVPLMPDLGLPPSALSTNVSNPGYSSLATQRNAVKSSTAC